MSYAQQIADRLAPLRKASMAVLLVFLVISVFVIPFFTVRSSLVSRLVQDLLLSLILLAGMITASERPKAFPPISLLAFVAIIVRWASWLFPADLTQTIREETTLVAVALISAAVGVNVFGPGKVTADRINGAVVLYILMGLIWAKAYQLLSIFVPNAFHGATLSQDSNNPATWVYFSFVTLSTAGYGDILPLVPQARSLTNLEELIGQLYPAIVLARLVSLHLAGGDSDTNKS
ncbi:ion channel [Crenobacter sp. SG2303]|uniref:Ion channel n=1 Tax=Crenobacter oryzisoli TaxID=3056844 RepID=A0ABT7XJY6_9NEIS|nr:MULTISPECIES: ion channel [unclassified Crenobacter]MDN0074097.1 ion channel [Crenobacter sp. SG2303]MDN0084025.1 ion channel [Crenobacter sp. SG2305]